MFKRLSPLCVIASLACVAWSCEAPATSAQDVSQVTTRALINGCAAANLAACVYQPIQSKTVYTPHQEETITYTDYAGESRTFKVELRRPQSPQTPTPVVIWSHGGSAGRNQPAGIAQEWGEVFNKAGYVSIHVAHKKRTQAKTLALCDALSVEGCDVSCTQSSDCIEYADGTCEPTDMQCRYFKDPNWDRLDDVAQLLAWLEAESAPGEQFEGLLDLENIAYAGHSGGAGATMMAAGATRFYGDSNTQWSRLNSDIKAFISLSPQPPGEDGFVTGSFDGTLCNTLAADPSLCFSRPHLTVTGAGDDTNGTTAEDRRIPFELMPTGLKFLAWVDDEAARHGTFEHNPSKCPSYASSNGLDPAIYPARCTDQLVWIDSVVLAFLDGTLRSSSAARSWLRSGNVELLSDDVMSIEER